MKMESPPKISHDSFTFRFPARLWRIINSCSTGAISWGPSGKTIRILRKKFEEEYLTGDAKPFKTAKYESFVRQLNHYGFKKVKKRSAVKKISTPIVHGENKEEAAMLSEYFNPNFARGQPERVTFLERRSQLHDNGGLRKRNKRRSASVSVENQESTEKSTTTKKIKKETSVQVSQSLLPHGPNDGHRSPINDNNTKSAKLSGKPEKGRAVPTQTATSSAEGRNQTQHRASLYQPVSDQQDIPPQYQHSASEGNALRAEGQLMYQRRPYYNGNNMEPRYLRPPLASSFSQHLSPPWQQPFRPCPPTQPYDHFYFGACDDREEYFYPPFAPEYRHMVTVRSQETGRYPPVPFPDNRYFPMRHPDAWDPVYGMNRRYGISMTGDMDNEYNGRNIIGKRMKWSQKQLVNTYDLAPPHDRHMVAPDPFSMWSHRQFSSMESRAGLQWRTPDFAGDIRSVSEASNDSRMAKGYNPTQGFRNSLGQSVMRQVSTCSYSQPKALPEPPAAYPADFEMAKEAVEPGTVKNLNKNISNNSGLNDADYHEQTEALVPSASKNEGGSQAYSENLHIITDDAVDLPLDVAEETVITCNATSTVTSDHSLTLTQTSSAVDTLMNSSTSLSPEGTPESFHLPTENRGSSSRHPYGQDIDTYTSYHSNAMDSRNFPQQFTDNLNASQEGSPKPYTPVPAWTYSDAQQQRATNGHYNVQDRPSPSWTPHAPKTEEEAINIEGCTNAHKHMLLPFTTNGTANSESSPFQRNHAYALNDPTDCEVGHPKTSSPAENGYPKSNVLVQREERTDLTQLSSTSVQELLSAALRTPGMKIMVDDNYHPEKMVLVLPKGKRREVSGCV